MSTIAEVAGRFAKLNLIKEAGIAISITSKAMIKAQQKQRYEEGIDGKGKPLPPYKSITYAFKKLNMNPNDVTDLTLTGELNSKMYVLVEDKHFIINSSDDNIDRLEKLKGYGKDIMGLHESYMGDYIEESFAPQLYAQIEKITGLEMK
jgi:hypothetical protein